MIRGHRPPPRSNVGIRGRRPPPPPRNNNNVGIRRPHPPPRNNNIGIRGPHRPPLRNKNVGIRGRRPGGVRGHDRRPPRNDRGIRGGQKALIMSHRHEGVFYAKTGKEDVVLTKNMVPGQSVYNEKRISNQVVNSSPLSFFLMN